MAPEVEEQGNAFWLASRRFGTHTRTSLRIVRLRWIVLALGGIIFALGAVLLVVVRDLQTARKELTEQIEAAQVARNGAPAKSSRVTLLVPRTRIEAGKPVRNEDLVPMEVGFEQVPEGVVAAGAESSVVGKIAKASLSPFAPIGLSGPERFTHQTGSRTCATGISRRICDR